MCNLCTEPALQVKWLLRIPHDATPLPTHNPMRVTPPLLHPTALQHGLKGNRAVSGSVWSVVTAATRAFPIQLSPSVEKAQTLADVCAGTDPEQAWVLQVIKRTKAAAGRGFLQVLHAAAIWVWCIRPLLAGSRPHMRQCSCMQAQQAERHGSAYLGSSNCCGCPQQQQILSNHCVSILPLCTTTVETEHTEQLTNLKLPWLPCLQSSIIHHP